MLILFTFEIDDSYIKVSNSLGFRDLNLSQVFANFEINQTTYSIENKIVESLQKQLFAKWRQIVFSNVQSVELYDLSINLTFADNNSSVVLSNETTLIITYLMKLDPRISQVSQIIYKLLNVVNSTILNSKSDIYEDIYLFNSKGILLSNGQVSR